MAAFLFPTEIETHTVPAFFTRFLDIVSYDALSRRITALQQRRRANVYADIVLARRHSLEFTIWHVITHYRTYHRLPRTQSQAGLHFDYYRAYDFIVMFVRVFESLNDLGQRRLRGRVRHAFTDENDFGSLAQEMSVVGNLMRFQCTVSFHDLENDNGGYDFLASREGIDFEVECKVISADKGRQIHQHDTVVFAEFIAPVLDWGEFELNHQGAIVDIEIPARLSREPAILTAMAHQVKNTLRSGIGDSTDHCVTRLITFELGDTPFALQQAYDEVAIREFIQNISGQQNDHYLIRAHQGRAALILNLRSRKPDKVVSFAYDSLKDGAEQLSRERPGLLIATFSGLPGSELVHLAENVKNNGFEAIATRLFRGTSRDHIFGVHFLGILDYGFTTRGYIGATGPVYRFFNPNSPYSEELRLRMDPTR